MGQESLRILRFSPVIIIPPMRHTKSFIYHRQCIKVKVKVKFTLEDHEDPDEEYRYSSTLSSTSALDGVGGQPHALAALPGRDPLPIVYEAGWAPGPIWEGDRRYIISSTSSVVKKKIHF